jgi:tetratricopeptide (TPR) repeat protein
MASNQLLQQAIAAYKAGHRGKARALLLAYVETDQQNELAWLLLSNLVNNLEDRIIALENVLTINPHNSKAATQLWKLKRKRSQDPVQRVDNYQLRLEDAIEAKAKGQGLVAYSMLRQLVQEDDRNEQAWLLLSELSPDIESEITALQNLLLLNPAHTEAKARLEKLQRFRNDPLALGKLYEDWGEEEKARDLYVRVAFESSSIAERWEAERRMKNSEMREYAPGMRLVSPRVTLARMMAGPIALYGALAFIHGGLNPLKIAPVFWLGGFSVIIGSFLIVVASIPDTRIIWQRMWAKLSDKTNTPQEGLQFLGVTLCVLPICLIVLDGFLRIWDTF